MLIRKLNKTTTHPSYKYSLVNNDAGGNMEVCFNKEDVPKVLKLLHLSTEAGWIFFTKNLSRYLPDKESTLRLVESL